MCVFYTRTIYKGREEVWGNHQTYFSDLKPEAAEGLVTILRLGWPACFHLPRSVAVLNSKSHVLGILSVPINQEG